MDFTTIDFVYTASIAVNAAIVFLFGRFIKADNILAWFVLVVINTIIWIWSKQRYGTTVRRIVEKQLIESIATIGLVFAARVIAKPLELEGLSAIIFTMLTLRQALFIFFKAQQVFSQHDLDEKGFITNSIFKRLYKFIGQKFELDIESLADMGVVQNVNQDKSPDEIQKNNDTIECNKINTDNSQSTSNGISDVSGNSE